MKGNYAIRIDGGRQKDRQTEELFGKRGHE